MAKVAGLPSSNEVRQVYACSIVMLYGGVVSQRTPPSDSLWKHVAPVLHMLPWVSSSDCSAHISPVIVLIHNEGLLM